MLIVVKLCSIISENDRRVYILDIFDNGIRWCILKRYRDIYNLNKKLVNMNYIFDDFPKKKLFNSMSLTNLEYRVTKLNSYFDNLTANNMVLNLDIFLKFIKSDIYIDNVSQLQYSEDISNINNKFLNLLNDYELLKKDITNRKIIILETLDKNEQLLTDIINIGDQFDKLHSEISLIKDIPMLNYKQTEIIKIFETISIQLLRLKMKKDIISAENFNHLEYISDLRNSINNIKAIVNIIDNEVKNIQFVQDIWDTKKYESITIKLLEFIDALTLFNS